MPTYDYKCEHCGRFQVTQRITEDPLKECPTCVFISLDHLFVLNSFQP